MLYKATERANLIVNGSQFEDWTSIWVQRTWGNSYDQFKFTCAERDGATSDEVQASAQFTPGDDCTIELAGQKAISGMILSRQTAYDANSRGVQLQGTSQTWPFATSTVKHKTNNFRGKSFKDVVNEVLEPTGAPEPEWKGDIPEEKFEFCRTQKGETIFTFVERLARDINVVVTCNKDGKFVFVGENGQSDAGNQGQLIEGENILKMQCVHSIEQAYRTLSFSGSTNALQGDKVYFKKASEQKAEYEDEKSPLKYRHYGGTIEQPTVMEKGKNSVEARLETEKMWQDGSKMNATIVVYGWQPSGSGALWEPGSDVTVNSPMAMLDGKLRIQSVTYTQDSNSGTLTTLVCVSPNALQGPKRALSF